MDSRHLQYFVALGDTLHFGNAAARVNMTQPPFSRQIAGLEAHLGVRLVERSSRRVRLTAAGEQFLKDARRILAEIDRAVRDAKLIAEGKKGELRIGFMMHAADSLLPELTERFRMTHPEVRLSLSEIVPDEIIPRLLQGEIDVGISFAGRAVPGLLAVPLQKDRLCLILPHGHRLSDRSQIGAADLRDEELILAPREVSSTLRDAVLGYFTAAGAMPRIGLEPRLQHSITRFVAAGLGVALVPQSVAERTGADVVQVALQSPPVLELVLLTQKGTENPAVRALIAAIDARGDIRQNPQQA